MTPKLNVIKIYQLKNIADTAYAFRSYNEALAAGMSFEEDYILMYACSRAYGNPDDAYYEFNCNRPSEFRGHSLSVSDIVEINGIKYYCDDFGWRLI